MTHDAHSAGGAAGGHGHAVVIGSSLAGLTAARALANFMDRVTVIERDWVPRGPGRRRGVPQARHTHGLTTAAQHGLEQLFPGIVKELTGAGAVLVRMTEDMLLLGPGGWLPRADCDLTTLSASRDLMDALIRDRLRADPRVTFLQKHEALSLEPGRQDTVTGVWVRARDPKAPDGWGTRHLLTADFVVDATGRGSRAPQWLAELGYAPPRETVVDARTAFATAVFAPPVGHVADWKSLLLMPASGHPAQGMLNPIEGGRWSVSVCAGDGGRPPADHAELLRAAGTLRDPLLRDVLEAATPLGPVYSCGPTGNRWRHYEKLRRWPDQFLVVGDAFAALDPAHGQGMTAAVQCALVLDQMLAAHGTAVGLGYRLRRAIAHRLAPAWQASTRALRAAQGDQNQDRQAGWRARLGSRYAARLAAAATTDPCAATLLLQQLQAAAPPAAALRPSAIRAALRGPRGPVPAGPPSTTHGPNARRRRAVAPEAPAIGVSTGSARWRPATGSSAQWPTTASACDRRQP
ncbi:NAD(P)/FAD-dependent oxidoreductase [Streptomyces sp. DH24]|uniref:NAD(P)/FAD-dependent oxidoreductase n=1 Tax=Streptomyces sp. DH24 TaxID=3040123 RepID=UPI00244211B9|nr:FAD-dependent monooxygenase [Streptomyces sp. DH24]MDG9720176.1 FAD-dependent monooxygenase [Streptomyces sp. DH24]